MPMIILSRVQKVLLKKFAIVPTLLIGANERKSEEEELQEEEEEELEEDSGEVDEEDDNDVELEDFS